MDERGKSYEVRPAAGPMSSGERRIALVIGNGRYVQESEALNNPPNDARSMAKALSRIGYYGVQTDGDDFTVDFGTSCVPALLDLNHQRLGCALAAEELTSLPPQSTHILSLYRGGCLIGQWSECPPGASTAMLRPPGSGE